MGFGGLGKTTLAMELCRHLEADFQRQALVSVSQAFDAGKDMKGLLARVLRQIEKAMQTDEMDVQGLSSKLNEVLKDKRYMLLYLTQMLTLLVSIIFNRLNIIYIRL